MPGHFAGQLADFNYHYHSAMLVFESFTQPSSITTANVMKKDGGVLLYEVNKDDFKDRFPRS